MISIRNLITELQKDNKTTEALSDFLLCTGQEIINTLQIIATPAMQGSITTKLFTGQPLAIEEGYYSFQKAKKKKGAFRTITIPDDSIKSLQSTMAQRFEKINLSTAAIGGERGFDFLQNAAFHRHNRYMYSIDLKDAFPSVDQDRIHANISSSLAKIFQFSYPYLDRDQHQLLAMALTHLTSHKGFLPQGTTTSMKLLNIVMAQVDKEIITCIHDKKRHFLNPRYTRYVDDIVISVHDVGVEKDIALDLLWKYNVLREKLWAIKNKNDAEAYCQELRGILFHIIHNNSKQRKSMSKNALEEIHNQISLRLKQSDETFGLDEWQKNVEFTLGKIEKEHGRGGLNQLQAEIRQILYNHGREIQPEKEQMRYPGSHQPLRQVTGVSIDANGVFYVPKEKMEKYIQFLETIVKTPHMLPTKFYKDNAFTGAIAKSLKGIRDHIERVRGKGNFTSEWKYRYEKASVELMKNGIQLPVSKNQEKTGE